MNKSVFDIVGIGTGGMDLLHVKKETIKMPGGAAANTICALQKLGVRTGYIGRVGNDDNGRIFIDSMKNTDVDISRLRIMKGKTAICHIKVSPNRRKILGYGNLKPIKKLKKDDIEYLKSTNAIFIRLSHPAISQVSTFCTKNNKRLFVTMHQYDLHTDPFELIDGHKVDVLFSSMRTARRLKSHIKNILDNGTIVVITKGIEGCEVYRNNELIDYQGLKMFMIDPTGAGDAFAAGFIFGILNRWYIEKTCDFANFIGAMATTEIGARSRIVTLEDYKVFKESGLKKLVM